MKKTEDARKVYADIIDLPYHKSNTRKHISLYDRAAQFASFKALSGFSDLIEEQDRYTDCRIELEEDHKAYLDTQLQIIQNIIDTHPLVTFTYFIPDAKKAGGIYHTVKDCVIKIDLYNRNILTRSGTKIPVDDIIDIQI